MGLLKWLEAHTTKEIHVSVSPGPHSRVRSIDRTRKVWRNLTDRTRPFGGRLKQDTDVEYWDQMLPGSEIHTYVEPIEPVTGSSSVTERHIIRPEGTVSLVTADPSRTETRRSTTRENVKRRKRLK